MDFRISLILIIPICLAAKHVNQVGNDYPHQPMAQVDVQDPLNKQNIPPQNQVNQGQAIAQNQGQPVVQNQGQPVLRNQGQPVVQNQAPVVQNQGQPIVQNPQQPININRNDVNNPYPNARNPVINPNNPNVNPNNPNVNPNNPIVNANDVRYNQQAAVPNQFNRNPNPNPQGGYPNHKPEDRMSLLISQTVECRDDVARLCAHNRQLNNNFEVISCLNNDRDDDDLSDECHQYVWNYKLEITKNPKFHSIAVQVCQSTISQSSFPFCKDESLNSTTGYFIPCLLEHKDEIHNKMCNNFLAKIGAIVFSDYRLICNFMEDCHQSISWLNCGRADSAARDDNTPHSQGQVIACLEDRIAEGNRIEDKCEKQILRLAELSSDDFHLDRNLYFKCRGDRETLCGEILSGEGQVYKCLFDNKFDRRMSASCREALTTRQKLISEDYKASYGIATACGEDIKTHGCVKSVDPNQSEFHGLSNILLCLEDAKFSGIKLKPTCVDELMTFRRALLEDYELSPELVRSCAGEITNHCEGVKKGGGTINCLLDLTQDVNKPLGQSCEKALEDLIKESEVITDYRMDQALAHSCHLAVTIYCSEFKEGDPMVLSCLMENIHKPKVSSDCHKKMLDLQYFISRDFNLDPNFREACRQEATDLCNSEIGGGQGEDEDIDKIPYQLVMSCLYRHTPRMIQETMVSTGSRIAITRLTERCESEVMRILHERALDFELNPDLEQSCRTELGKLCSNEMVEKGKELICLQDHYENITSQDCKKILVELTSLEEEDAGELLEKGNLENLLVAECEPMLHKFCKNKLDSADEGEVMACLIEHKEEMESKKCAAGVTHFQLIEMKDYHFNFKFIKSCKEDVEIFCQNKGNSKADVVNCLSKRVRDQILMEEEHEVSAKCREQLTFEKLQMHKNFDLNPKLKGACDIDYSKYCSHISPGKAKVIECLRTQHKLSKPCRKMIMQFEQEEVENPDLDYNLMKICKTDIKVYCLEHTGNNGLVDRTTIINCLMENKPKLRRDCKEIVRSREEEIFSDIFFNVDLMKHCKKDVDQHCRQEKMDAKILHDAGEDPHGIVYDCLKDKFNDDNDALRESCQEHILFVIQEEQKDFRLDPQVMLNCIDVIDAQCKPDDHPNVMECLKEAYFSNGLDSSPKCMVDVARLLRDGRSDIYADPILHQACANDLDALCSHIPEGHGRLITCLMQQSKDDTSKISQECKDQLLTRSEMWEEAGKKKMTGFSELQHLILASENSSYLLSVMTFVLLSLLIIGIMCGRVTKRANRERKLL